MDNLTFEEIIKKTKVDKDFPLKYLNHLFNYHNENLKLPISCSSPLASIKCFTPLPTRLLLSKLYSDIDNIVKLTDYEYQFHGSPGKRIVFSDKILPYLSNNKVPIPFSFPVYGDKQISIVMSNIYYYELTMGPKTSNLPNWDTECISIGFGNKNTTFKSHVGWYNDSFGFHSDDGTFRHNCSSTSINQISKTWETGDVAGAGIIFTSHNQIKPFFTFNGKLIYINKEVYQMKEPFFPIIGYDHSHSIKLNFSNKKFKFNILKMINDHSNYIISTNNSFLIDYDISHYLNEQPLIPFPSKNNNLQSNITEMFNSPNSNGIQYSSLLFNFPFTGQSPINVNDSDW